MPPDALQFGQVNTIVHKRIQSQHWASLLPLSVTAADLHTPDRKWPLSFLANCFLNSVLKTIKEKCPLLKEVMFSYRLLLYLPDPSVHSYFNFSVFFSRVKGKEFHKANFSTFQRAFDFTVSFPNICHLQMKRECLTWLNSTKRMVEGISFPMLKMCDFFF